MSTHPKTPLTSPATGPNVLDCYVRNSSAFQIDNWRADYQREQLPLIVERLGYTPQVWEEQGKSGESLTKRKVMQGILRRIRNHESAGVACVSFDRLSRDVRLKDGLEIWDVCREAGAVIVTPDRVWHPADENEVDDDGAIMNFWAAGKENRRRMRNLYEGMVQKAAVEPLFRGRVPYGYQRHFEEYIDHRGRRTTHSVWEIDPEVAHVVRWIFVEYPKRSARQLTSELNAKGQTDPVWLHKSWNVDGTFNRYAWYSNDLARVVHNPIYKGLLVWGRKPRSRRFRALLAQRGGEPFEHQRDALAIVSAELWLAAQATKPGNPSLAWRGEGVHPRTVGRNAIFSGKLRCPACNGLMYATQSHMRSRFTTYTISVYVCGRYQRGGRALCKPYQVHERDVQAEIRAVLYARLPQMGLPELVETRLARLQSPQRRAELEAQKQRWTDGLHQLMLDRYEHGRIDDATFDTVKGSLQAKCAGVDAELKRMEAKEREQGLATEALRLLARIATEASAPPTQPVPPLDPPMSSRSMLPVPTSSRPKDRLTLDEEDAWRLVMRLFESVTIAYQASGATRKAAVGIADLCWDPEIALLLEIHDGCFVSSPA